MLELKLSNDREPLVRTVYLKTTLRSKQRSRIYENLRFYIDIAALSYDKAMV
jgi:hypothetical protein